MQRKPILIFTLLTLLSPNLQASDLEKERRWADQITDALLDGEARYLEDGQGEFLAIETPAADGSKGKTAIIMHGTGVHPDWPTVVQPLRVRLTEMGWNTLSIQMPILDNDAPHEAYAAIYDEVPGRLDAAIDHARQNGAEKLVLIAHSQGSTMTAYYLANGGKKTDGLIAIGMGPGIAGGPMDNLEHLRSIRIPMLDLYGSSDLEEVVASATERRRIASASNADYTQIMVTGADHFFDGEEKLLFEQVSGWLNKHEEL